MRLSVVLLAILAVSVPPSFIQGITEEDALAFLEKYQYMATGRVQSGSEVVQTQDVFRKAVMDFQRIAKIEVTGEMNNDTEEWMKKARCGLPDGEMLHSNISSTRHNKRYSTYTKWDQTYLSYRIINFSPDLPEYTQRSEIKEAFKQWAAYTPLSFHEGHTSFTDIEISFASYNHSAGDYDCGYPFEGPGSVLAHAYFPQTGWIHMDESETWTSGVEQDYNFYQVFLHEVGHALGLEHSDVEESVMYPYYMGYVSNKGLHQDDIDGIQSLYGKAPLILPSSAVTSKPSISTHFYFLLATCLSWIVVHHRN